MTKSEIFKRRARVANMAAAGVSERKMADRLDCNLKTVQRDLAFIRGKAREEVSQLDLLSFAAARRAKFGLRGRLLFGRFLAEPDNRAAAAIHAQILANEAAEVRLLQSLGLLYKMPEQAIHDLRFHQIIDSLPDGLVQRMAALPAPEAQKLLRAELGEARYAALGLETGEIAPDPAPAGGGPSLRLA
jgi:hypothetical protein